MATCIKQVTYSNRSEARMKINRAKKLTRKIMQMITIDGDNFSNSKDWPYLWSKHK